MVFYLPGLPLGLSVPSAAPHAHTHPSVSCERSCSPSQTQLSSSQNVMTLLLLLSPLSPGTHYQSLQFSMLSHLRPFPAPSPPYPIPTQLFFSFLVIPSPLPTWSSPPHPKPQRSPQNWAFSVCHKALLSDSCCFITKPWPPPHNGP